MPKHVSIRCTNCRKPKRFEKRLRPRGAWLCDPCKVRIHASIDAILDPPKVEGEAKVKRVKVKGKSYMPVPYSKTMSTGGQDVFIGFSPMDDANQLVKAKPQAPVRRVINRRRWLGSGEGEVVAQGRH